MMRTNIGGLADRETILFMTLMSSMLYVAPQSSIILSPSIIPGRFFTIIIFPLIDGSHIFVCYISQDNVFCACLSSSTHNVWLRNTGA